MHVNPDKKPENRGGAGSVRPMFAHMPAEKKYRAGYDLKANVTRGEFSEAVALYYEQLAPSLDPRTLYRMQQHP